MEIYTDGACEPNPGKGGWAFVILDNEDLPGVVGRGFDLETTSNRMELKAILEAIKYALTQNEKSILICSDSKYCIGMCTGWNAKKNKDLVNEITERLIDAESLGFEIDFEWVKGHDGNQGNEFADFYASSLL